jgi:O-antigen ligase
MRTSPRSLLGLPLYAFALTAPVSVAIGSVAVAMVGGVALLRQLFPATRSVALPPRPVLVALALFVGTHALATALAAPFPAHWATWRGEMFLKLLLLAVPLLAADRPRDVERAAQLLVLVGAAVAVYGIYQHFAGWDLWRGTRTFDTGHGYFAVGFFDHHLSYGGHVLLLWTLGAAWALLADPGQRRARGSLLAVAATALLTAALLWSYARSAQLGAGACAVALTLMLRGRRRLLGLAVLGALVTAVMVSPFLFARFSAMSAAGSESTRINLWRSSLHAIHARPWTGFGAGNFQEMMRAYGLPAQYDTIAHAHNDFLMHAVNAGLPGLAAALLMLCSTTLVLWLGRGRAGRARWVVLAGVCAQFAISVAGLFQVYQTDNEVEMVLYFLLGCGLALISRGSPAAALQEATVSGTTFAAAPRSGAGIRPACAAAGSSFT